MNFWSSGHITEIKSEIHKRRITATVRKKPMVPRNGGTVRLWLAVSGLRAQASLANTCQARCLPNKPSKFAWPLAQGVREAGTSDLLFSAPANLRCFKIADSKNPWFWIPWNGILGGPLEPGISPGQTAPTLPKIDHISTLYRFWFHFWSDFASKISQNVSKIDKTST